MLFHVHLVAVERICAPDKPIANPRIEPSNVIKSVKERISLNGRAGFAPRALSIVSS